ncbi:hypothetical protein E3N88_41735 [Mikania micrantha]|uniref:Uncharacterized protein n=1 Tax=Mikania micrantha TaxID=192012 RepID=A0A5N6LJR8_9ASTR|nr:hypothetical protein E3N88_41735 [Mikania micrantha]
MHDFSGFSQPQDGFSQPTYGVRDLSGRVDRLEGMMRWMTERMAASAGMDIPVFPGPGHHQDPQDPGGHA